MHSIRKWIRFLFGFSRRETNGFLILLPLMVITVFSRPLSRMLMRQDSPDFSREVAILDSLEALIEKSPPESSTTTVEAFSFDPNRATVAELESLGFSRRLADRIINYRAKGGRFRRKSDLLRIYGMDTTTYTRLYPFIELPVAMPALRHAAASVSEKSSARATVKIAPFDLNEADTATLMKVRGIGPVLAQRIVRYRSVLGGFVSRVQLFEVYRLDTAAVDALFRSAFIGENFVPRLIHANTSDEYELARHPYIGKTLAKAIVAYRFQHGTFGRVEDIRQIHHVDDSVFQRILPYLSVD